MYCVDCNITLSYNKLIITHCQFTMATKIELKNYNISLER